MTEKVTINIPVTMERYEYEYARRQSMLLGISLNEYVLKDFVAQI